MVWMSLQTQLLALGGTSHDEALGEINGHEKVGCSAVKFFYEHHCAFGVHTLYLKQAQLLVRLVTSLRKFT
jgi:hypothetical protein